MPATATTLASWPAASWQHLTALAAFAIVITIVIALARRWNAAGTTRSAKAARRLTLTIGTFGIAAYLISLAFYLHPARFAWNKSLPFEMCDIAALIAPFAIISGNRNLRGLLHFWGFALCTQFFITPVHSPGSEAFIVGWVLHASIVGLALYDTAALGFRPTWQDLRFAILTGAAYVALIFTFNLITGFNYGYVGPSKPGKPTIVDALGPWPLRVLWIALIGSSGSLAVMLIGTALRTLTQTPSEPRAQARGQNR